MAVYTTIFNCMPHELLPGFRGWREPLAKPANRQFTNPFTGETTTIETREPEWPVEENADTTIRDYHVISSEGGYEDYLEGRLPSLVRASSHWAAKGLTNVELEALAQAVGVTAEFECPIYGPPSSGAVLMEFPPDMVSNLASLDHAGLERVAARWAATMSTPDYTHSVTGERLSEGWAPSEAIEILRPLVDLALQATNGQRMYLLIEV